MSVEDVKNAKAKWEAIKANEKAKADARIKRGEKIAVVAAEHNAVTVPAYEEYQRVRRLNPGIDLRVKRI